ncbi:MAG TPA: hypoxanthine phosphoribosyltransferase [Candidatus Limnocylindria bacterium]|nr:hypoxanthine phosphoribosyltransferase [Candidatus Limnocylindria bacterium]
MYGDLSRVLLSEAEIAAEVGKLADRLTQDYAGKAPVFVCILKGAAVFFTDLIRKVNLPLTTDFMAISSYGSSTKTSGVVRILKDLDHDVLGRDVVVVEDIVDSGLTLSYIRTVLRERGAATVRLAALLDKPMRRRTELDVDYRCFLVPDEFVVGYGLDYAEKYRNLPLIGVLHPRIYTPE